MLLSILRWSTKAKISQETSSKSGITRKWLSLYLDFTQSHSKDKSLFFSKICDAVLIKGSPACCGPWGHRESDPTEQLNWTVLKKMRIMMVSLCCFSLRKMTLVWVNIQQVSSMDNMSGDLNLNKIQTKPNGHHSFLHLSHIYWVPVSDTEDRNWILHPQQRTWKTRPHPHRSFVLKRNVEGKKQIDILILGQGGSLWLYIGSALRQVHYKWGSPRPGW